MMPIILANFLFDLAPNDASDIRDWLTDDWRSKAQKYPITEMVELAGKRNHETTDRT